ncbi:TfoX/Sxy family protein [Clostridium thermobutyricum]|uniref:TfoX/Sxy family protein n=1 Tax=Clostridium thermobutyricum TaxID=29372 RepID=UPI0018AA6F68|nr:TfoX/Sxy family protein [Clostridium thermobutyricum]
MEELSKLINIGKTLEKQLNQIGIYTEAELKEIGAEQAWLKIKKIDKSACMNRLLALEGAIMGIKKTFLPEERKNELKEFYKRSKNF